MTPAVLSQKAHLIFILHHFDEMRHPYNAALAPYCRRVKWFSNQETLLAAARKETPLIVIVDLECLTAAIDQDLEAIKLRFTESDFIALSSDHSAQNALHCLRLGFAEFLLKPTSPAELAWSVRKCIDHREVYQNHRAAKQDIWKVAARISACHTPSIVRLSTLRYISDTLGANGAVWFRQEAADPTVLSITPSEKLPLPVQQSLVKLFKKTLPKKRRLIRAMKSQMFKLFIPCRDTQQGILVWEIKQKPPRVKLEAAEAIRQYGEVSLLNISRFEEVKQETFIDDLTGLFNSRYLKFALSNAITRANEHNQSFSILFIDVDHFKSINDKHGHLVGSDFLVAIARTIKNAVRQIDPVFRYGGDEFVVILLDTALDGAKEIGERIRRNIEKRVFHIQTQEVKTTVSIGIAAYPEHTRERDTLLQLADAAMYHAKKHTRNAVFLAFGLPTRDETKDSGRDA